MREIGKQYPKDDITDPSGFLKKAREHQSAFRAKYLNLPYDTYGNYLTREDGEKGKNFYNGFDIFEKVERYSAYNKPLYSNMLRSEHIPFNMFIPVYKDQNYSKHVFSDILKHDITSIDRIEIEYAPKPRKNYLKDRTSFDAYFEYTSADNTKGIIGIEVKYTEKEYKLTPHSKQETDVKNHESPYFSVSKASGIYKPNAIELLPSDKFRQLWRNHILGESILITDKDKFSHFTSLTVFPEGNKHFKNTSKDYIDLLINNENKFIALTYEDLFALLTKHCPNNDYKKWIDYMILRYIVPKD